MAPKSKAGQRLAGFVEGLDALAERLGLRWFMDDHGTQNIFFYLQDNSTGKVLHGPFTDICDLEDTLNSLHRADTSPGQLS
jgi:hypothetical protein